MGEGAINLARCAIHPKFTMPLKNEKNAGSNCLKQFVERKT
jgi:hypothetical protein